MSSDQKPPESNQAKNDIRKQEPKQAKKCTNPVDYTITEKLLMGIPYVLGITPLGKALQSVFDIKHKLIKPSVKALSDLSHEHSSAFGIASDPAQRKISKPVMVLLIIVVLAIALLLVASLLTKK